MKRRYHNLKLKLGYIIEGFKAIRGINLGDVVIYNGKRYFVNNGVSYPICDLIAIEDMKKPMRKSVHVHRDKFKKEMSIKSMSRAFKLAYKFNMRNWHNINLRQNEEEIE